MMAVPKLWRSYAYCSATSGVGALGLGCTLKPASPMSNVITSTKPNDMFVGLLESVEKPPVAHQHRAVAVRGDVRLQRVALLRRDSRAAEDAAPVAELDVHALFFQGGNPLQLLRAGLRQRGVASRRGVTRYGAVTPERFERILQEQFAYLHQFSPRIGTAR